MTESATKKDSWRFHVERIEKYGRMVWRHAVMDHLRSSECLCLNCALLENCDIAEEGFEFAKKYGVAYAMTRCPEWKPGEGIIHSSREQYEEAT